MSIFSVILKRLEPRVPAALLGDPDTRQRSLLAIGCAYSFAAVSLSLVPFMGSTAEGLLRLIPMVNTAASAALLLLTGPLLRRTRSLRVAGNWMTGLLFAGLTFALFSGGMVSAPFWGAMIVLPLLATVLAGRGSGVAWGVAVCATYMLVYALDRSGVTPTDLTPPGMRDQMTVLGAVASTVVVTIVVILADATHRDAIQKMQRTHDQLEDAIVERERAQLQAHEAVAANAAKSAFLATMSHELRTPLNAIIGYTELLIDDAAGSPDAARREELEDLRRIRGAGEHLLNLISDVLDISRIEASRMDMSPETFDLGALLEEVVALLEPLAEKRHNQLRARIAGALPRVHLDRARVRQVLVNVVGNALKFTERGEVVLSARRRAEPPGVTIEITDTGIGIPADKLEQIFQPFTQVDPSRTREYEGTGLGLAICRRLLEMMSGTITARSRVGEGSAFTIELPTAIAAPAVLTTPTRAAS